MAFPPPPACEVREIPLAYAHKLVCIVGRQVDKHTHGFIVQIHSGRFISFLSDDTFSQHLLSSYSIRGTVMDVRNTKMDKNMASDFEKPMMKEGR